MTTNSTNTEAIHGKPTAGAGGRTNLATLFVRSVRAEWVKLRSVRSFYGCTLAAIALSVLIGLLLAWAIGAGEAEGVTEGASAASLAAAGLTLGQIALLVLAALVITGEYSTSAIRTTLAASPARPALLAAKAVVVFVVAAVTAAISVVLGTLAIAPLPAASIESTPRIVAEYVGYSVIGVGLFSLLVLSLGTLIRSSAATITLTVALLFVPAIVASMASNDTVADVVSYLPAALQDALMRGGDATTHSVGTASLLLAVWAVGAFVVATVTFSRRDA